MSISDVLSIFGGGNVAEGVLGTQRVLFLNRPVFLEEVSPCLGRLKLSGSAGEEEADSAAWTNSLPPARLSPHWEQPTLSPLALCHEAETGPSFLLPLPLALFFPC